jgi:hypothetical protein
VSDQEKDLPAVPSNIDTGLKRTLDAMREALQRMMGKRGDGGRAAVLWDDLVGGGLADERRNINPIDMSAIAGIVQGAKGDKGDPGQGLEPPDLTKPLTPTGLTASGALASIIVQWGAPIYTAGHGHKQTNIYATKQPAGSATLYTINDAVRVSAAPGAQSIASIASDLNVKWRVWIRFESVDGVESDPAGGVNGFVVETGQDVAQLKASLTGQLQAAQLAQELAQPIALIPSKARTFKQRAVPTASAVGDLWIDEGGTNKFARSQNIVGWTSFQLRAVPQVIPSFTAPDGTQTGDAIVEDTSNFEHAVDSYEQFGSGPGVYTISVYMRSIYATDRMGALGMFSASSNNHYARFDFLTGAATVQIGGGTAGMVYVGDGWWRCWLTANITDPGAPIHRIGIVKPSAPGYRQAYTGDGTNGLRVWGMQLEFGSGPGRYIPTTTAAVSTTGNNKQYRWSGTAWDAADDKRLAATAAAVATEAQARIDGDSANASLITTVRSTFANASGNRVSNSSFELDSNNDGLADGFTVYNNSGMAYTASRTPGRLGGFAQKIDFTGPANQSQQGIVVEGANRPWEPGKTYVAALYAKAGGGQVGMSLATRWNVGPQAQEVLLNPALTTAWQRYAFKLTMQAGTVESGGRLYLTTSDGWVNRNGPIEFDDVTIYEGGELLAYEPGRDGGGAMTAAVQTEASTRASQTGQLFAKYGVKLDVNGYTIGWTANNDGAQGTIVFRTDTFIVGGTGQAPIQPFVIRTSATTEGGVTVPAGVYMDSAYITNLTAMWARFGTLVADSIQTTDISAAQLKLGNGTIGGILKSTNYTSGTLGWIVRPDGYAEFNNVVVRGTVYATTGEFSATVRMGAASSFSAGNGLWQGLSGTNYVWRVGAAGGNRAQWDGTTFQIYTNGSSTPLLSAGGISASSGQLVINTPGLTLDGAGNATFSGSLNAATGTFSGQLAAGTVDPSVFDAIVLPAYTSAGNFTATVPAKKSGWTGIALRATLQAPGGGGGGGYASGAPNRNPTSSGGGGGAGGSIVFQWEGLTSGQTVNISLGGAGSPGSASTSEYTNGGWGGNGGNAAVSIPALSLSQSVNGGNGGEGGSMGRADSGAPTNGGSIGGGQGGSGTGGVVQGTDFDGQSYSYFSGPAFNGGAGGSSLKGSGGGGGTYALYPSYSASGGGNGGTGAGGGGGAANAIDSDVGVAGWGGWGGGGYILLEFYDPNSVVTNKRYAQLINWLDTRGFGSVPTGAR